MAAALLTCLTLVGLGGIHFYWALGGTLGKAGAVPTRPGGGGENRPVLSPSPVSTAGVGVSLLAMAAIVAMTSGIVQPWLPATFLRGTCVGLAVLFAARAIGEFRYLGFFKRVRGTVFAARDSAIYSPLCLVLALVIALIART